MVSPQSKQNTRRFADIRVPSVDCPFEPHVAEESDRLAAVVDRWASDTGLVDADESVCAQAASPQFVRCVHPNATGVEREFIAKWYCWGFLEDDRRDEGSPDDPSDAVAAQQEFVDIATGESRADEHPPLARALADLRQEWEMLGTPQWRARFTRHHIRYFLAHIWETTNRAKSHVPVRGEYVMETRVAAGLPLVFDMAALTSEIDRKSELYRSRQYQRLLRSAANVVCWTNDLYSLKRELLDGDVNNLVLVVRVERDCSLQTAVDAVTECITEETATFSRIADEVETTFTQAGLRDHIKQLKRVIAGHMAYSQKTGRYDV